ncbi:MAG: phosphopantetheine-binding protein [Bacteroidales bacterium]|jgi:acyl carrier protein|nr:phosphopantetheine-binding protein [Bacteroidales bacterium]
MEKIYEELAELLEVDNINDDDVLKEFEAWDSLTILSIIALASENYNKTLLAKDINGAENVGNLIALITA